jgi:adenylyltransferase/sulfurtransferase
VTAADREAARRLLVARTELLRGAGPGSSERLARASVLVVGAGGLGSPVVALLAGAGLGRLTIVDPDVVDPTNLARQTLFTAADVGAPKAERAAARARAVDPSLRADAVIGTFDAALVTGHDVVVDAADSVLVTRAVSDACAGAGIPFVWGSALGYDGQVSTFWDARGIDFHDLHPEPLPDEGSCAVDGVLPALCHAVGSVMAAQVLALVAGIGEPLLGTVLTVDAATWTWDRSTLRRGPASVRPTAAPGVASGSVAFVSVSDVVDAADADGLAFVDVRTPAERAVDRIPGSIAPDELRDETDLVIVCERGPRAVSWAAANAGSGRRIRVLDGGMRAWRAAGGELVAPISNPSG